MGKSINEKSNAELNSKEIRFKNSIAKTLKPGWFMDILNQDGIPVVSLQYGFNEKAVETYSSIKNIEGFITEIGDRELEAKGLHIYLSEALDYKVFITIEQHNEIAKFYRKAKIRAKVILKKSLSTNKVLSAKLLTYKQKNEFNFPYNLNDIDFTDINFIHEYK